MTWYFNLFRTFFTFLDRIVYQLISWGYELLLYLANLDLFGMSRVAEEGAAVSPIVTFSSRIYAFLGIFMLFRLAFSILQYIMDPDSFSDKTKGFGKLVRNVLISLILVVATPFIFSFALNVQTRVLDSNIIGNLVLGTNNSENANSTNAELSEDMKFLVYSTFMPVNTKVMSECVDTPILGTKAMASNDKCLQNVANKLNDKNIAIDDFFGVTGDRNFNSFGDAVLVTVDGEYLFDYMPLITTAVGGLIAVFMIGFCIDIAVRVVKLAFLEMIAPVPIISYMDPRQAGKDGMLSRWAKECLNTYLSLFIRLAIIYFVFYVVDLISGALLSGDNAVYLNGDIPNRLMSGLVVVMVIIGLLTFAKQVPKLLESVFGIKDSGSLTFNPLKNDAFGRALGVAGGAIFGGVTTGIAAGVTAASFNKPVFGSALGGVASGIARGGFGGLTNSKDPLKAAKLSAGRTMRNMEVRQQTGGFFGAPGRLADRARYAFGGPTEYESLERNAKKHDAIKGHVDKIKDIAKTALAKKDKNWQTIQSKKEAARIRRDELLKSVFDSRTKLTSDFENERAAIENSKHFTDEQRTKAITDLQNEYDQQMSRLSDNQIYSEYNTAMGALTDEENAAIANYINSSNDLEIELERKAMKADVKDIYPGDPNYKFDVDKADWEALEAAGKASKNQAIKIRSDEKYNNAKDRDTMIKDTSRQAHFKH